MPKQKRMAAKLSKLYPHYLNPSGRIWIAQVGNLFRKDNKLWQITRVALSPIPGASPVLDLEVVQDDE